MQLSGDFTKINLPTLLSLCANGKLTGKLFVQQGIELTTIFLKDGQVVYCTLGVLIGLDALMEVFLWSTAQFFYEENSQASDLNHPITITLDSQSLIQEGLEYRKKRTFLDELGVTVRTILIPTSEAYQLLSQTQDNFLKYIIENLNGIHTIAQAFEPLQLSLVALIDLLYKLISQKLVVSIPAPTNQNLHVQELPDWVIAKLTNDNNNIHQAIIDLVIWSDRAKAMLHSIEKDLSQAIEKLSNKLGSTTTTKEDLYDMLNHGVFSDELMTVDEPLFGEFKLPNSQK